MPEDHELPDRLAPVLSVIYLCSTRARRLLGRRPVRTDLCLEAIRLAATSPSWMPDEPEVLGCWRCCCSPSHGGQPAPTRTAPWSASPSKTAPCGTPRSSRRARPSCARLRRNTPGPYQIQAAIAAVHSDARGADDTKWDQIVALYDQLYVFVPTPVVA